MFVCLQSPSNQSFCVYVLVYVMYIVFVCMFVCLLSPSTTKVFILATG